MVASIIILLSIIERDIFHTTLDDIVFWDLNSVQLCSILERADQGDPDATREKWGSAGRSARYLI